MPRAEPSGPPLEAEFAPGSPLAEESVRSALAAHDDVIGQSRALGSGSLELDFNGPLLHLSRRTRLSRVEVDGRSLVVKQYLPRSSRVGRWLHGDGARTAFETALACRSRGVPIPSPLALVHRGSDGSGFIIMEYFGGADASMLHLFLATHAGAAAGSAPYLARCRLARAVGVFLADLHTEGVDPGDLAAQNVLVRSREDGEGFDLALVDWDDVRLRSKLTRRRRIRHLTQLVDLPDYVPVRDRLRALRAYRARCGLEVSRADVRAVVAGVAARADAKARRARRREASGDSRGGIPPPTPKDGG